MKIKKQPKNSGKQIIDRKKTRLNIQYVYVYVYMCVSMCVHMCAYMYVCECVRVHVYACANVCTCDNGGQSFYHNNDIIFAYWEMRNENNNI